MEPITRGWHECPVCGDEWLLDLRPITRRWLLRRIGPRAYVCDWCSDSEDPWAKCYWCGSWQYDALSFVGDDELHPLCNPCLDWLDWCWGGPYEPSAQTRCFAHLRLALARELDDALLFCIAECLYAWFEP